MKSLAAVRPSAVRVAPMLRALRRCPRTGGPSVRFGCDAVRIPLPYHGGAAAVALPKALWLLRSSAPAHAATLPHPAGVARCAPHGTPLPVAEALLLARPCGRFCCCAPPPMTCWRRLRCHLTTPCDTRGIDAPLFGPRTPTVG